MKLSIIIPAYNEEDNIIEVVNQVEHFLDDMPHELILVNDHSTDNTGECLNELARQYNNIRLVENKSEKGFANALKSGFNHASADLIVPVMADLCDDLSTIKRMFAKINEGNDIVCGSRYTQAGARLGGSRLKAFLSYLGGVSLYYLLGISTHDIANAFKMYKKRVIESIEIKSKGFEISMEIPLKAYYLGFRIAEVPTVWRERTKGKSSFRIFKLLPSYLKLYVWAIFKRLIR